MALNNGMVFARTLAALGLSAVVGFAGMSLHVPLAWTLGPLITAACISIAGVELKPSDNMRRLGQLIIGAAVGLHMSAPVLVELLRWFPLIVLSALFAVLVSCAAGVVLGVFARIDHKTAFFACLPGGLAEMGNIGAKMGARPEPIAIVQTLRVTLVVIIVPPILLTLGTPDYSVPGVTATISKYWAIGLIGGGICLAYLLRYIHLNNPFIIGSILFASILAANDLVSGGMPPLLFSFAQLLIGFGVGCRFRASMLVKLPRVIIFGAITVAGMVVVMAAYALLVFELTGLPYPTAILATAPGGVSEMAIAAQVLHLAVPAVVGFQLARGILVNGLASHFFTLLTKLGFFAMLQRLFGSTGPNE